MNDDWRHRPRPGLWFTVGLLHGVLFLAFVASQQRSPWWLFYCGFMCGSLLTQSWFERRYAARLGSGGPEVPPAPSAGTLVQPWLFRELATWPLVAVLLAPLFVGLASGLAFPPAVMLVPLLILGIVGAPSTLLTGLLVASTGMWSWRLREHRLGPARRTGQRALHAAKVTALFTLALLAIPGDLDASPPMRTLDALLIGPRLLRQSWPIAAGAAFLAGWATIELRDRFARRAARRTTRMDAAPSVSADATR